MVEIYFHDEDDTVDFRQPHNSGQTVPLEHLSKIGLFYRYCATQEEVDQIAKERTYRNRDVVKLSDATMGDVLMAKLETFYKEHLHEDEEIRYCIDGAGYFDVRDDSTNRWIRCKVTPGDLLVLPAGIYHRFTLTDSNDITALRLFKDEPKWVAHNRPEADVREIRKEYLASLATN